MGDVPLIPGEILANSGVDVGSRINRHTSLSGPGYVYVCGPTNTWGRKDGQFNDRDHLVYALCEVKYAPALESGTIRTTSK